MSKYQHAILNTSRWESETIVEWLQYYISLGFDHAYIYCNDDDPVEMYEKLRPYIECADPFVTFHHIPFQGQQPACWIHFLENYKHETEWFLFIDADEFLALKPHNSIKQFMLEFERDFDCIHFNWIWFGPENFDERPKGSTLLQFTHREDERRQMNYFTKTINRSAAIDPRKIGRPPIDMLNHRWPATISASLREANVLGESMAEFMSNFPASAEHFMSDIGRRESIVAKAVLYHYLFRSKKDFQRRVERGTLGAYYFQPMWGKLPTRQEEFSAFLGGLATCEDLYLHDYWKGQVEVVRSRARATSIVKPHGGANLARSARATQSSICQWSKGQTVEEDARGAINGIITGTDGFHTQHEPNPWWSADLGAPAFVDEIRVYNSLKDPGMAARAYPLVIDTSCDGRTWDRLFFNAGSSPYGGADGHPLIVRVGRDVQHVKLWLDATDFFHLDEVEIYGRTVG